jgi:hypothetical protein
VIHTKQHLVFSRGQESARPAQGGRFAGPVGPDADLVAKIRATPGVTLDQKISALAKLQADLDRALLLREKHGIPPPEPAPVIDEELERERARLLGKRVRSATFGDTYTVERVSRNIDGRLVCEGDGQGGYITEWTKCAVPIPEPPRVMTFAEVAPGQRFRWLDRPDLAPRLRGTDDLEGSCLRLWAERAVEVLPARLDEVAGGAE